jgi:phage baseplate assembly protein W
MKHTSDFLGSGWAFPVSFSTANYRVATNSSIVNINDNIRIIMRTALGQRVFQPLFGSGLGDYQFNKIDATLKGSLASAVKKALLNSEPRISVLNVEVIVTDSAAGIVDISITYMSNQTNTRHNYVFPYHLNEGTNL